MVRLQVISKQSLCRGRLSTQIFETSSQLRLESVPPPAIYTTVACLLPDVVPFQLPTLSPARDILPVSV
jgi:hypothetical protein